MKNIVIIIIDALRPKSLSMFGYEKETDKNLKIIAKESLLFTNHFSSSNSTAPSLTSLFTGKYPDTHGIIHQFPYTKEEEINKLKENKFWFPSYLQKKGYETIAIDWIGLWFKKGFNYYEEKEKTNTVKFLGHPFIKKILLNLPAWAYKLGKKITKKRSYTLFSPANKTMDLAISKVKKSKKPFFLFMHFWDTHFPFPTVKDFKSSHRQDVNEVLKSIKDKSQREYFKKRITDINLNSIKDMSDKYDLAIKLIDSQIGRLYNYLKKQKLWDNTIFIVLGDHGENTSEHGIYFSHSGLFDDSIHVPMIMHLPGYKGNKINKLVQNIDILPTILEELNDKDKKTGAEGKSLIPLIKTNKPIRNQVKFFDGLSENIRGIRTKKKKLIIAENPKCHLCKASHHKAKEEYDLEADPKEENNIYKGKSELEKFLK